MDEDVDEDCTRTVTRTPIMSPTTGLLSKVDCLNTTPGGGGGREGTGVKDLTARYVYITVKSVPCVIDYGYRLCFFCVFVCLRFVFVLRIY